jgi:hypothetical protein
MTEREILEQIEEINQLLDEMESRNVYIGDPDQTVEVTDDYVRYMMNFIRENELYDDVSLNPLTP